jgi:hypothetical protein
VWHDTHILKGDNMSEAYDPKTYNEDEFPLSKRKFMSFHGTSFCGVQDKAIIKVIVGVGDFCDGNGYDEKEIFRIHNLGLAEVYKSNSYIDHCIVRIK